MFHHIRIGGGHLYKIPAGIVDLEDRPRIGNGFLRLRIHLDRFQVCLELRIVDEVLIGLAVLGDADGKGRHQLSAVPAFRLLHNILAVGQILALGESVLIADKDVPLVRIRCIEAADRSQIDLKFRTRLRGLNLSLAVICMLDKGHIALNDFFGYAHRNGVVFNGKIAGFCADRVNGFI